MKALILILTDTAIVAAGQQRNTTVVRTVTGARLSGHRDAFAQRIQPSRRTRNAQSQDA